MFNSEIGEKVTLRASVCFLAGFLRALGRRPPCERCSREEDADGKSTRRLILGSGNPDRSSRRDCVLVVFVLIVLIERSFFSCPVQGSMIGNGTAVREAGPSPPVPLELACHRCHRCHREKPNIRHARLIPLSPVWEMAQLLRLLTVPSTL